MSLKSILASLLLSTTLLSSASLAMEENGSLEERPGSTKASPLKLRDIYHSKAELLSILKDNEGNPLKYHKDYENFANEMLSYAEKSIENSGGKLQENLSDLDIIKEQLRTYCDKNTLNLPRLTWLSLQIGMVLTPRELRNRPGQAETISKQMNGFDPGIKDEALQPIFYLRPPKRRGLNEEYLLPYSSKLDTLNLLGLDVIFSQRLYYPLCLVGGGRFTDQDFLDSYMNKIYLSVLANQEELPRFGVHGGLLMTPIEVLLHDLYHLSESLEFHSKAFSMQNCEAQKEWITAAVHMTSITQQMLKSEAFTPEEKTKLAFLTFFGVHEINTSIENRALRKTQEYAWNEKDKTILNLKLMKAFLQDIDDYATTVKSDLDNLREDLIKAKRALAKEKAIVSLASPELLEQKTQAVAKIEERRTLRKKFHRDLAYTFIRMGELNEEDVKAEGAKILGVTYNITPVIETLHSFTAWMRKELEDETGRMRPFFAVAKKSS